jgi:hypothetical protein
LSGTGPAGEIGQRPRILKPHRQQDLFEYIRSEYIRILRKDSTSSAVTEGGFATELDAIALVDVSKDSSRR